MHLSWGGPVCSGHFGACLGNAFKHPNYRPHFTPPPSPPNPYPSFSRRRATSYSVFWFCSALSSLSTYKIDFWEGRTLPNSGKEMLFGHTFRGINFQIVYFKMIGTTSEYDVRSIFSLTFSFWFIPGSLAKTRLIECSLSGDLLCHYSMTGCSLFTLFNSLSVVSMVSSSDGVTK